MRQKLVFYLKVIYIIFYIVLPFIALNLSVKQILFSDPVWKDIFLALAIIVVIIIILNIVLTYNKLPQTLSGMLSLVFIPVVFILFYALLGKVSWQESILEISFIYILVSTIGYFYFIYTDIIKTEKLAWKKITETGPHLFFLFSGVALAGLIWLAIYSYNLMEGNNIWWVGVNLGWITILDAIVLCKNLKIY